MVVRLEGKVNGQNVIFNRKRGDEWEATVPKNISGVYIVELTAYDEVGNKGYAAKYLVTIDVENMKVILKRMPWKASIEKTDYDAKCRVSPYVCCIRSVNFCGKVKAGEYYGRILK